MDPQYQAFEGLQSILLAMALTVNMFSLMEQTVLIMLISTLLIAGRLLT